ncbi:LAMI_0E00298g1_1 [Lachancea mirantina]|uniref:LAMI_0E00298g1_1 n=1 Tax=Lachancea mirantina TaxID=1230905 RepID=A0A1G4JIS4_9SACH|nr:LAMI_0E00298g1_1 [Lachancea mirantina]
MNGGCGLLSLTLTVFALAASCIQIPTKDHQNRGYFAVQSKLSSKELLALHPDWTFEHDVRALENHYVFSHSSEAKKSEIYEKREFSGIEMIHELPPKRLNKRLPVSDYPTDSSSARLWDVKEKLDIADPLFERQWHLINSNYLGNDVNVTGLWFENITGQGVVAAVVDDGLDYESEDLRDNFSAEGSWDFNDNGPLPKPRLKDDYHGTRCAGEIAAVRNEACGLGVAYNAKVAGIRILSGEITSEDEAASLVYALDTNDIYSCSWGPSDDGATLQGPDDLVKKAMIRGITSGRKEKGAIYVFASGNGGVFDDNCNYDGYTNSIYSITVGAIDHKGLHPPYAESCSAVLVVTYSSGSGEFIHSTDINGGCSETHGGTSAAAPLAAGIYALVLEANPDLTWRDVQYLTILSSVEINTEDGLWQQGALGKRYSHKYGYGKLDAYRIARLARDWENVNPQAWYYLPTTPVDKSSKSASDEIHSTVTVSEEDLKRFNLRRIEHITVTINLETTFRGRTVVDLVSPSGMVSNLGVPRRGDNSPQGFKDWTFMSVAHWGETGVGDWKLIVKTINDDNNVTLKDWRLKLFGEAIDAQKAAKFEFGNDREFVGSSTGVMSGDGAQNAAYSTISLSSLAQSPTTTPMTSTQDPAETEELIPSSTAVADEHGTNKGNVINNSSYAMHYFIALFVVSAIFLVMYVLFFSRSRRRIRRTRAEAYEFDIIDTDSENDSSLDSSRNTTAPMIDDSTEFDFDLSDEELLRSSSNSPINQHVSAAPTNIDAVMENITQESTKVSGAGLTGETKNPH